MHERRQEEWQASKAISALIKALSWWFPFVLSFGAARGVAALIGSPASTLQSVLWWAAVIPTSFVTYRLVDHAVTRLLPLEALFRMSLVFPDKAPSRYKIARNAGNLEYLRAQVDRLARHDQTIDPSEAAEIVLSLVSSLAKHDRRTRGHSERTRVFTDLVADEMELPRAARDRLRWAALLHDIGKLDVASDILNKPGKPTDEEWTALKQHPLRGSILIAPLRPWLGEWALAVEHHHERYDGAGYPHQLAGDQISLGGRIVAVADAFETMTAARSYKKPMPVQAAREELVRCAGGQFDPAVVRAFLRVSLERRKWIPSVISTMAQSPVVASLQNVGGQAAAVARNLTVGAAVAGTAATALAVPTPILIEPVREREAPATAFVEQASQGDASSLVTVPPATRPSPKPKPSPAPSPGVTPTPTTTPTPAPTTPANTARPKASADSAETSEDRPTRVDVQSNDNVPGDDPATVEVTQGPSHGSARPDRSGAIWYVPSLNYFGVDEFTYRICIAAGCASAAVAITITPVNDRPTARADSASTSTDAPVVIEVLTNDSDVDGDALTVSSFKESSKRGGTVSCTTDGRCVYRPKEGFGGDDSFTYRASDGALSDGATVTIRVAGGSAPVAVADHATTSRGEWVNIDVLANDSDPDGDIHKKTLRVQTPPDVGTAEVRGSKIRYTPPNNFEGSVTFTYRICDRAGHCSVGTVRVDVIG